MNAYITDPEAYSAALYIRLSKEDEREGPSESVSNQRAMLEGFAMANRLNVYDAYIDDGWSGTDFDRPGFKRLIADVEAGRVNMVITKDLSRLGRDYIMTGHFMERYFPEKGVRYISLLDNIDTGIESSANDITPFRAIMNDMYARDISRKIKSVKRDKQRRGEFIGRKPVYGYMPDPLQKNRIVIDERAAPTVRRVFAMALDGLSCRQIAIRLNAEGIPPPAVYAGLRVSVNGPYSGLWSGESISNMLRNETYAGSMVQGRSVKVSYKSKKRRRQAPEDWIVVENTHEPIVSREVFLRAGAMIESRRSTRCRTYDHLLKGMIFCHECGKPLSVINRKTAAGEDVLYFVCRTYQRFTKSGVCTGHTVKERTVSEAVRKRLRELCRASIDAARLLPEAVEAIRSRDTAASDELRSLRSRIAALTAAMDRTYSDRLSGLLDEEDFCRIYAEMKAERSAMEERRAELERIGERQGSEAERAEQLAERFAADAFSCRETLVTIVERIELTADRELIIRLKCREPAEDRHLRGAQCDVSLH